MILSDFKLVSSSASVRLANEFLLSHSLSELLPYRCFDPETLLFHNKSGMGFVLETLPLVGCGDEMPRQLTGFFQHTLPQGSNLQTLLIASPRIEKVLGEWQKRRDEKSEILKDLAGERCAYLKKTSSLRTFTRSQ